MRQRQPERVLAALALKPGEVVADVGAGMGLYTHLLARAVGPHGRVIATDVDPAALARIAASPESSGGEAPIETRLVTPDTPALEPGAYDLIFLSEVDQYLPDRARYLTRLRPSLRPGGRIAVTNREIYRAPLYAAATAAGLTARTPAISLDGSFLVLLEAPR